MIFCRVMLSHLPKFSSVDSVIFFIKQLMSIKEIFWKGGLSGKICHVFLRINNRYWQLWKLDDIVFRVKIWFHVIFLYRMCPNNPSKTFFQWKRRIHIKLTPNLPRNSLEKKVWDLTIKRSENLPPSCILPPPGKTEGFWGQPHRVLCRTDFLTITPQLSTMLVRKEL